MWRRELEERGMPVGTGRVIRTTLMSNKIPTSFRKTCLPGWKVKSFSETFTNTDTELLPSAKRKSTSCLKG